MNCLTAGINTTQSLDNTYYSDPRGIIQSHCNLVPRRLDSVTSSLSHMVITDITTRLTHCWINELQSFFLKKGLISESLEMRKPTQSIVKLHEDKLCVQTVSLFMIHIRFSIHIYYWLNQLILICFQNIPKLTQPNKTCKLRKAILIFNWIRNTKCEWVAFNETSLSRIIPPWVRQSLSVNHTHLSVLSIASKKKKKEIKQLHQGVFWCTHLAWFSNVSWEFIIITYS